ncbi:PucR family transcriptional regulator [Nonomuraea ferruginea]
MQVVARRTGLRLLAGSPDRDVRWVAVSELEDPTPFLEGGELVLTTGMRLTHDFARYVGRLMARGVAGLGVAVGLTHDEVPPALVEAAGAAGLPLLEVPRETPFIAVTKVVSELLAAEQYEEVTRAFAAQGRLTRAALHPDGTHAVIDRLAKELGGWAALFDDAGEPLHATRGAKVRTVAAEIRRLRGGRGPAAARKDGEAERAPATLALAWPGENVVVQPVGGGPRPRGFFAVGTARAFTPVSHTVVNAAGSLLTLALEQGRAHLEGERRVRDAVLRLLLSERPSALPEARTVLGPLGPALPGEPFVVLAVGEDSLEPLEPLAFTARLPNPDDRRGTSKGDGPGRAPAGGLRVPDEGQDAASGPDDRRGTSRGERPVVGESGGRDVAASGRRDVPGVRASVGERAAGAGRHPGSGEGRRDVSGARSLPSEERRDASVRGGGERAAVSGRGSGGGVVVVLVEEGSEGEVVRAAGGGVGIGGPCSYRELRAGVEQARRAYEHAGGQVLRFGELAGQGLMALVEPEAAGAFAAALLAPLAAYGSRADLVESLRAYLESNGHWDAAAQRLGVHRHTLRYRMRRVAELLGRDLDDPGVRAELWFALQAAGGRSSNGAAHP